MTKLVLVFLLSRFSFQLFAQTVTSKVSDAEGNLCVNGTIMCNVHMWEQTPIFARRFGDCGDKRPALKNKKVDL